LLRFARNDGHCEERSDEATCLSRRSQLVYLGEANPESLLTLTENAGFSPAFIYEAEGFVLKRFKRF